MDAHLNTWNRFTTCSGWMLAPAVGLEPTTKRLTAARSTTELRRSEDAGSWAIAEATNVVGAGSRHRAKG